MGISKPLRLRISDDDGASWSEFLLKPAVETTQPAPTQPPTAPPVAPSPTPAPSPPSPTPPAPSPSPSPTIMDKNGIKLPQPFTATEGVTLSYSNETWTFDKNFRSDGSMRCDFNGVKNSVLLVGYFLVKGSDSGEEVSAKMNGGPHNDTNPEYADTMDMGIVNFAGDKSRIRWEKSHPNYSSSISPTYKELPVGNITGKWLGYIGMKVNLPDGRIGLVGMVDVGGIGTDGKPVNNWKITFKRIFTQSEIGLKSVLTPYVATIGHPELAQNTIRIDQQGQSEWKSSNPPYKFVSAKEITASK